MLSDYIKKLIEFYLLLDLLGENNVLKQDNLRIDHIVLIYKLQILMFMKKQESKNINFATITRRNLFKLSTISRNKSQSNDTKSRFL
jgi:hypothetical protein